MGSLMADVRYILNRIETKKLDYEQYDFTQIESSLLTTFFDLSQEFDGIEQFYLMCVFLPKVFFGYEARLYVTDQKISDLHLIASTNSKGSSLHTAPAADVQPSEHPYYSASGSLVLTVRGNRLLMDQLPFKPKGNVLGLLEIFPVKELGTHRELFFEKYANRIGYNIHNRFLVEKNIEHLRFIRSLVADIEHNVIAPNMIYKLYLKHLRRKIVRNKELEQSLTEAVSRGVAGQEIINKLIAEWNEVNRGLTDELENIEKHYQNMSLFLETLFRRSHFDKGRLTLLRKPCKMKKDVVQPQLERYAGQFKEMGIEIADQYSGIPDEEIISVVDVGLMAQVYANLFSNAIKYTEEVYTHEGARKKYVAYGREDVKDFFGPGNDGVKYNMFSTGSHIPPSERDKVFEDEYRGSNVASRPGTGHGLAFIKNAVELHGGIVGYEATQYGNNFYFILPK